MNAHIKKDFVANRIYVIVVTPVLAIVFQIFMIIINKFTP